MSKFRPSFFLSVYLPIAPYVFVYMLQQVEYEAGPFLDWTNRIPNYRKVIKRKKLVLSKKALVLLILAYGAWLLGLAIVIFSLLHSLYGIAALLFAWLPALIIFILAGIVAIGNRLLKFKRRKDLRRAREKMQHHKGIKIAVLGSYGKTTMKELLATVLSEGKQVAVTPGNMNVAISHARWIVTKLSGEEDIVIFEFGEAKPGDIADLASLTNPDYAVLTGFAPNHIETYKSVEALKADLTSIQQFVSADKIFVSEQANEQLDLKLEPTQTFGDKHSLDWKFKVTNNDFDGLNIELEKSKKTLKLESGLLGKHLAPPLAFAAALADRLGVNREAIQAGTKKAVPFEHRLKPRLVNGAWVIDDTYNGNIEGIKAGLALLKDLPGKRKIYVTPGLVEQGSEKERVHIEIATHIIHTAPDEVVLMRNSATDIIAHELKKRDFTGKVTMIDEPLSYYEQLPYHLAGGDVVMMQNDWTDNYA